jgi:hypothetical protein
MKTALQSLGGFLLWAVMLVVSILVLVFLIKVGAQVAVWALPILDTVYQITFVLNIIILLPLAIFKKTRSYAGIGFYVSSYIFGVDLWLFSFLMTYAFFGTLGVILGVVLWGVGVVPIAAFAFLLHGLWSSFFEILLGLIPVFGTRYLGIRLMAAREEIAVEAQNMELDHTDIHEL